jgi:hypothetical protein
MSVSCVVLKVHMHHTGGGNIIIGVGAMSGCLEKHRLRYYSKKIGQVVDRGSPHINPGMPDQTTRVPIIN